MNKTKEMLRTKEQKRGEKFNFDPDHAMLERAAKE